MAKQLNVNLAFTADTSQAKAQLQDLQNQLKNLSTNPLGDSTFSKFTPEIQKAAQSAAELSVHLKQATNVDTGMLDFSKLNQSFKQSGTNLKDYAMQLKNLGPAGQQAFMSLAQSISSSEVPIRRANGLLTEMATTLKNTARWQISSSILHGFMGSLQKAYGYAQDLNKSLNNIRIVTGKSVDDMAAFAERANKAAQALSATTTAYTDASLIYYQQGLSDSEVQERTEATIKMANVTGQSAQIVSDQMTAVWNNFDDGSKSLEYYADVMTALGAATASSTDEIAQGLEKFAAIADTVGLSYEYATAALATVTAETRQSADVVGTAFKTLFARIEGLSLGETLEDGTDLNKYSEALMKVGINIKDQNGGLREMDDILNDMGSKWSSLSKDQQVALAQTVGGVRQYNQLISLMDNWDKFQQNLGTAYDSSGTLEEQQEIYAESWEAARDRVKAAAESIYQSLLDDDFFIDVLNLIEGLINGFDSLIDSAGGFLGVLSSIGLVLSKVFEKQMAQGIRNMAYNLKMSTEMGRTKEQEAKANTIKEMSQQMALSAANGGTIAEKTASTVYEKQLTVQEEFLRNQQHMSEIDQQRSKILMDQLQTMGEQNIELAKQKDQATSQLSDTAVKIIGKAGMEDNVTTEDTQKELARLKNVSQTTASVQNQLKDISNQSKLAETDISKVIQRIKDLNVKDQKTGKIIDEVVSDKELQDLEILMKQLQSAEGDADEVNISLKQIGDSLASIREKALNQATENIAGNQADDLRTYSEQAIEAGKATEDLQRGTDNFNKSVDSTAESIKKNSGQVTDWATRVTSFAQGLMGLTSMISAAKGAIDALTNPDLSGWEKFWSVLQSSGMIITTLVMSVTAMRTALAGLEKGWIANTIASGANTVAEWLNYQAKKMNADVSKDKANAVNTETEEIKDNTEANIANTISEYSHNGKNYKKFKGSDGKEYLKGENDSIYRVGKKGFQQTNKKDSAKFLKEYNDQLNSSKAPTEKVLKPMQNLKNAFGNLKTSAGKFITTHSKMIKGFGLAAAGIAIVVTSVTLAIKAYNKYEDAAKKAAEQAQQAAAAYQAVSQSYDSFANSLSSYKDAKSGLENLTEGTNEYREAVLKANESAMALMKTNKDLIYTIDDNGLIVIDEESLERAQQAQLDILQNAQQANQLAQLNADKAELTVKKKQFQRDELSSSQGRWTNVGNAAAMTLSGVAAGALIGSSVPIIGTIIGGAIGALAGTISSVVAGSAANEEEEALEKLVNIYQEEGNARFANDEEFKKLLTEDLGLDDKALINSLMENRDATLDLVAEMATAKTEEQAYNENVIITKYGEEIKNQASSEETANAIITAMGKDLGKLSEDKQSNYEDKWFGKTDAEIQKAYAEAMGWDPKKIDNLNGNKATYYDREGNEVAKELSDKVARQYLAQADALEDVGKDMDLYISNIEKVVVAGNSLAEGAGNAFTNFIGGKGGNFNTLTKEQFNALQEQGISDYDKQNKSFMIGNTEITNEVAAAYGYESALVYYEALINGIDKTASNWEGIDLSNIISTNLADGLSQKASETIQNLFNSIDDSEKTQLKQSLSAMLSEVPKETQVKMLEAMQGINWDEWNAKEQYQNKLKEMGISWTNSINSFTQQARLATGAIADFDLEAIQSEIKNLNDIAKNLDIGDTISSEQYATLPDNLRSYFTIMADGTAQLTALASEFQQAIKDNIREDLNETKEGLQNRLNTYEKFQGMSKEDLEKLKTAAVLQNTTDKLISSSVSTSTTKSAGDTIYHKNITAEGQRTWEFDYDVLTKKIDLLVATGAKSEDWANKQKEKLPYTSGVHQVTSEKQTQTIDNMSMGGATVTPEMQIADYTYEKSSTEQVINEVKNAFKGIDVSGEIDELFNDMFATEVEYARTADSLKELSMLKDAGEIQSEEAYAARWKELNELEKWEGVDSKEVDNYALGLMDAAEASGLLSDELKDNADAAKTVALYTTKMNQGIDKLADGYEDWSDVLKNSNKASKEYMDAMSNMKDAMSDVLGISEEFIDNDFIIDHMEDIEKAAQGDAQAIDRLAMAAAKNILVNIKIEDDDIQNQILNLHDILTAQISDIELGVTLDDGAFLAKAQEIVSTAGMTVDQANAYFGALGFEPTFVEEEKTVSSKKPITKTVTQDSTEVKTYPDGREVSLPATETYSYISGYTDVPETIMVPAMSTDGKTPQIKSLTKKSSGSMNNYSSLNSGGKAPGSNSGSSKNSNKKEPVKKSDTVERYKEINDQLEDISRNLDKINDKMDDTYGQARLDAMDEYITNLEKENEALEKKGKEIERNISEDQQTVVDAAAGVGMSVEFDENGNIANATQIEEAWYARLASATTKDEQDEIQGYIDIWEDAQGDYEDSLNEFWDNEDAKRENRRKQQEKEFEKWNYKIELDVELDEGELALIDYYQNKLSDDIYGMAESVALTGQEVDIILGNLADREKQYAELTSLYESGKISQAQYAEGLKELQAAELEDLETLQQLQEEMEEYYANTLAMASEELDKYTARLERSTAMLEHYQDLLDLTGQGQNYDAMGKVLDAQQRTINNQYESSKKEYEMYKRQADDSYQKMLNATTDEDRERYKKEWEEAEQYANDAQDRTVDNAKKKAEIAAAIYENTLNRLNKQMETALTNGRSFDEVSIQMEHQQSLQEEYLTTTNKIYETTKMMRNLQNEIDKTTNSVAKQKLKAFQQETKQLQEQSKLSKFELDIQQAKYDLLLAEIALEEAQNAKSTVRLQRDSEGNFGYVYTADQEKVSNAEQAVDDAENALYNVQLEGANNYAEQSFQLQQEGLDALKELNESYRAGDIASEEEYQRRREEIINYYTQRLTDVSNLYGIAVADDSRVAADAWSTNITDLVADADTWKTETNKYTSEVDQAFSTLNIELAKIAEEMGLNIEDLTATISNVTKESDKWAKEMQDDVIPDMEDTIDEVKTLADALLKKLTPQIKDAAKKGEILAEKMYKTQKKLSGLAGEAEKSADRAANVAGQWRSYWDAVNNSDGGGNTIDDYPPGPDADDPPKFKTGDFYLSTKGYHYVWVEDKNLGISGYVNFDNLSKTSDGYWTPKSGTHLYQNMNFVKKGGSEFGFSKLYEPKKVLKTFDTGGYTGEWGSEGKLAALHEKELVLNKEDTKNFLASLELLHNIIKMIDINTSNNLISRLGSADLKTNKSNDVLEQHVTIEAVFPNVEDRYEIEEAFMNLTNEASQYINRKNN